MNDPRRNARASAIRRGLATLLLMTGALTAVVIPTGPVRAQDVTKSDATVRVVNASPGAPNLDVLIDGQAVVKDLAFGAATDYFPVSGGDHKIQIPPTGQDADAALVDSDLNVDAGDAYVFVVMDRLNDIEGKVFKVNVDTVDQGKARVRLIHASPDAGKVDLAVTGGDQLFGGVDFKDATDDKDVDAGTYSLDVKDDNDRVLLTAQNLDFADGETYDVVLLGQIADNSLALLPLATVVSVPCTRTLGLEGSADDSCVRIVHATPGTSQIDLYMNDSVLAKGVAYGKATEFIAVPKGDEHKLQLTAAGGTPGDNDLLDDDLTFDARKAYDVVITGNPDDLEAKNAEIDLSPLPAGQARVRVIHASPDAGGVNVVVADGPTLFDGVDYRDVTDFKTVDAATYNLQLKKNDTIALSGDVTVDAGTVYDIIVIGRTDDNSLALLVLPTTASVREGEVATPETQGTPVAGTAQATIVPTVPPVEATPAS